MTERLKRLDWCTSSGSPPAPLPVTGAVGSPVNPIAVK